MENKTKWIKVFVSILALTTLICSPILIQHLNTNKTVEFVNKVYSSEAIENYEETDNYLLETVSDEIYRYISLNNDERVLRTYVKTQGQKSDIEILRVLPVNRNHIIVDYKYTTGPISEDRTFRIETKLSKGKITSLSEQEVYFLPPFDREEMKKMEKKIKQKVNKI